MLLSEAPRRKGLPGKGAKVKEYPKTFPITKACATRVGMTKLSPTEERKRSLMRKARTEIKVSARPPKGRSRIRTTRADPIGIIGLTGLKANQTKRKERSPLRKARPSHTSAFGSIPRAGNPAGLTGSTGLAGTKVRIRERARSSGPTIHRPMAGLHFKVYPARL